MNLDGMNLIKGHSCMKTREQSIDLDTGFHVAAACWLVEAHAHFLPLVQYLWERMLLM